MKTILSEEWIDEALKLNREWDIEWMKIKYKITKKLEYHHNEFGKDYYYCEMETYNPERQPKYEQLRLF